MKEQLRKVIADIREDKDALREIGKNASLQIKADMGIDIPLDNNDYELIPIVVAYEFLTDIVKYLADNRGEFENKTIKFANIIEFGLSYRQNDEAEKEGNYVPTLTPLPSATITKTAKAKKDDK